MIEESISYITSIVCDHCQRGHALPYRKEEALFYFNTDYIWSSKNAFCCSCININPELRQCLLAGVESELRTCINCDRPNSKFFKEGYFNCKQCFVISYCNRFPKGHQVNRFFEARRIYNQLP